MSGCVVALVGILRLILRRRRRILVAALLVARLGVALLPGGGRALLPVGLRGRVLAVSERKAQ